MHVVIEGVSGPGKGRTINLRKDQVITIGRTEWSDVAIENDAQISARHFTIEHNGKVVVLNDLQSTNGVRVNGEDVQQVHLQDGDQISAGLTSFVVHVAESSEQHTPLAPNPYPSAPRDPAHPDNYATGQAPSIPQDQSQTPHGGDHATPGSGSPINSFQNPPPTNQRPPASPQPVGQSPIAGYQDMDGAPQPSSPSQSPNQAAPPASQSGSPISPIMYDAGAFEQAPTTDSQPGGMPGANSFDAVPQGTPPPSSSPPSPIQNSPISPPPPSPAKSQAPPAERHVVPSQRQKVKAAGAGALNFTRNETKNDLVIYKGIVDAEDEDREFAPSGLVALLANVGPYLLITHHQRAGGDAPDYASEALPLFDWMPPQTARGYSPIVIEANKIDKPFNEIDELWDNDALIVVLVKDPEQAIKHLIELTKWNPFGVEQNTMFGYCWPKVLAQFLEHGKQEMADRTFDNLITGFFFEDTNQAKSWQLIADVEFGKKLESLGFAEVQKQEEVKPEESAV